MENKKLKALELHESGRNYKQIADELNTSTATAWRWVQTALDEATQAQVYSIAVRRSIEENRLNAVMASFWDLMLGGDKAAAKIVLQTIAARVELYSLKAPQEINVTVHNDEVTVSQAELQRESIRRLSDSELQAQIDKLLPLVIEHGN